MDFFVIRENRHPQTGVIDIYPDFIVGPSKDLMIRGKYFYAVFDSSKNLWSTNESDVQKFVDAELRAYVKEHYPNKGEQRLNVKYMSNFSSNSWVNYRKYVSNMFDNAEMLDSTIYFANDTVTRDSYASKKLPYPVESGDISAWDELIGTLYDKENKAKIEWAIGSIVKGDSKDIQKLLVLYGSPGSGKSTVLNIVQKLFEGYYVIFDAKALTSGDSFSTEAFKSNPLIAIQQDGNLSKIKDNSVLNSIVSHDNIIVHEKYKPSYFQRSNAFLFMATNLPIEITDAKSGMIRRLIDVEPTGKRIPFSRYSLLFKQIDFELGSIAKHCLDVYNKMGMDYYDDYYPLEMIQQTDVLYNFVAENYFDFKDAEYVTLQRAWELYKQYTTDSNLRYILPKYKFKHELTNYFDKFLPDTDRAGKRVYNVYLGFLEEKITGKKKKEVVEVAPDSWIELKKQASILDETLKDCPAQLASDDGKPVNKWANVRTRLCDISTDKLHYVRVPKNHIVIDFDLKGENGEKSLEANLEAASKWPRTYVELSKSGKGVHLHYIYGGAVEELRNVYAENIEVKVFTGRSSLRRKLTMCNDIPVATLNSGLPLKGGNKVINYETINSERRLRDLVLRSLNKEFGATKPCMDFIKKLTDEAYNNGIHYDISDLYQSIVQFAMKSTNQSKYCLTLAQELKLKSDDIGESGSGKYKDDRLVFFDVEIFPNLFLVNWKYDQAESCTRMINPTPAEIEQLFGYKLVGFNNRRYDNHVLYARYLGYNNQQLYDLSQNIVNHTGNSGMFGEAYNISYTDVYDFASAGNKKSLKKWEIELGLHHQELGLPWDEPVPEDRWVEVAEYCDNDVISTEAVFHHLESDFKAREILAEIAGMTVNDTTNSLTTRIIFGKEKHPKLVYTDLATGKQYDYANREVSLSKYPNEFAGYSHERGHNFYRGEDVGRGGYVYATPGMYGYTVTLDVASMHPHSIIAMQCFGEYTSRFEELVDIRIAIKHGEYDAVAQLFDGKLKPYLTNKNDAKNLSNALKTAINSVYGLTSASFDNPFRDKRNVNNIVALRGALFMVDLKHKVQEKGFTVVHIKTDSIKIAEPTQEIIDFCVDYGKRYGYEFEVEAIWSRICLVNNAVFVGKQTPNSPQAPDRWTATGAQFAHPYVFKTLFSHEDLEFKDYCETKLTKSAFYLDMNEDLPEGEHDYRFVGRAGSFVPVEAGYGGGVLLRQESDGRMSAATGTKGYRWLESEYALVSNARSHIDKRYHENLAQQAINDISKYGDYQWFVEDISIPWLMPCGEQQIESCLDCPQFNKKHELCQLGFDISEVLIREVKNG